MLDIGFSELLVFGIIALLVLGPEKLPEAARFATKWYTKFKRAISSVQNDIDRELRLSEFREQMQQEMQKIQELEKKVEAQMHELQQQKIAAELENHTALTENKNPTILYFRFEQKVPMLYQTAIWLQQSCCTTQHQSTIELEHLQILPVETNIPELKVAV